MLFEVGKMQTLIQCAKQINLISSLGDVMMMMMIAKHSGGRFIPGPVCFLLDEAFKHCPSGISQTRICAVSGSELASQFMKTQTIKTGWCAITEKNMNLTPLFHQICHQCPHIKAPFTTGHSSS